MCSTTTHSVVTLPLYAVYWAPVFRTSCADPCTLSGFSASSCLWPLRWVLWGCSYVTDSVSQQSVKWQTCTNCSTSRGRHSVSSQHENNPSTCKYISDTRLDLTWQRKCLDCTSYVPRSVATGWLWINHRPLLVLQLKYVCPFQTKERQSVESTLWTSVSVNHLLWYKRIIMSERWRIFNHDLHGREPKSSAPRAQEV